MSAPTADRDPARIPNPHLITMLPDGISPQRVAEMCTQAAFRALEFELSMITSGVFGEFSQIIDRAKYFAACADESSAQRCTDPQAPSDRFPRVGDIAAAPAPARADAGVDERGDAARRSDDDVPRSPKHAAPEFPAVDPDSALAAGAPPVRSVFEKLSGALEGTVSPRATGEFPSPREIHETQIFPAVERGPAERR